MILVGNAASHATKISLQGVVGPQCWLRSPQVTPFFFALCLMGLIHWIWGFPAKSKSRVEVHPIFLGSLGWFFISQWEWLENLLSIQRDPGQHRGDNSWERGRDLVSPPDVILLLSCDPTRAVGGSAVHRALTDTAPAPKGLCSL